MNYIKESERVAKILVEKGIKNLDTVKRQDIYNLASIDMELVGNGKYLELERQNKEKYTFNYFLTLLNFDFVYQLRIHEATI